MSRTSKILSRLRDDRGLYDRRLLALEAAKEIERLEAEVNGLRKIILMNLPDYKRVIVSSVAGA